MKVSVSAEAAQHIRSHGGEIFVWAGGHCCGGTRFVEASTRAPRDARSFVLASDQGVTVHVRAAGGRLPEKIEVVLRGRRRPRVEAFWNGCAFVV